MVLSGESVLFNDYRNVIITTLVFTDKPIRIKKRWWMIKEQEISLKKYNRRWLNGWVFVLIHIWTKDEVGAPWNGLSRPGNIFTDHSKAVLLLWIIFVNFGLVLLCFLVRLLIYTLWSPAGKGVTLWFSFVMSNCEVDNFSIGILGQLWCLIVLIPDLCPLSYFDNLQTTMNTFSEALYFLHVEVKAVLDNYNSIKLETLFPSNNLG